MNVRIKMIIFHFAIMAIIAIIIILIVATFLKVKNTTFVILLILSIYFWGVLHINLKFKMRLENYLKSITQTIKLLKNICIFILMYFLMGS